VSKDLPGPGDFFLFQRLKRSWRRHRRTHELPEKGLNQGMAQGGEGGVGSSAVRAWPQSAGLSHVEPRTDLGRMRGCSSFQESTKRRIPEQKKASDDAYASSSAAVDDFYSWIERPRFRVSAVPSQSV
ncbi:unnamed protein product, partial [Nesidiocoris tenuis]